MFVGNNRFTWAQASTKQNRISKIPVSNGIHISSSRWISLVADILSLNLSPTLLKDSWSRPKFLLLCSRSLQICVWFVRLCSRVVCTVVFSCGLYGCVLVWFVRLCSRVVCTVVFSGKLLDQYVPVTQFSYLFPVGSQEQTRRRNTLQALLSICSLKTTGSTFD